MRKLLFLLCLLLPLAGCFKLQRPYPEREFFTLESHRGGEPGRSLLFGALRVDKIRVASPFDGKSFFYRTGELKYEEDFYNRFVASPGELIARNTAQWLAESGLFEAVHGGPSPVEPELFLSGEVSALYGDYRIRPAKGVLEITFTLTGGNNGGEVLLHRTYRQETPLAKGGSAAVAAGWSQALDRILTAFERDVQTTVAGTR